MQALSLVNNCQESFLLEDIIKSKLIRTVFQPIVSLRDCSILGYEALSRGPAGSRLESPYQMFTLAAKMERLWELEKVCRIKALESLGSKLKYFKLFLNINPNTMSDQNFRRGFTKEYLKQYQINPKDIVFEITEQHIVRNWDEFSKAISNYKDQNYQIAIDDVGTGYSGLSSIYQVNPHYLKLDMSFIRNVDKDHHKRSMIKCLLEYSKYTGAAVIAEGIETKSELEELIYLGVAYGQGYFIQKPLEQVGEIDEQVQEVIRNANKNKNRFYGRKLSDLYIGHLCIDIPTVDACVKAGEVFRLLSKQESLVGTCVIHDEKVTGIITKEKLHQKLSGHYGYSLYANRSISNIMDINFLSVDKKASIEEAAELAMNRPEGNIYDFIVVTDNSAYYGIVTIKDLLKKSIAIQINNAKHLNPLTGMPGNQLIEQTLNNLILDTAPFSLLYFDLDNFKVYNDLYGFEKGDQLILMLAEVIRENITDAHFTGHVGGDDFVAVLPYYDVAFVCGAIITEFERRIKLFYSKKTSSGRLYHRSKPPGRLRAFCSLLALHRGYQ